MIGDARRARAAPWWAGLLALAAAAGNDGAPPAPPDVAGPPRGAVTTGSGLAMVVLRAGGGGPPPSDNDCVRVEFTAWCRDGSLLGSTRIRGGPEVQCLPAAAPGVGEALRAMTTGEARRLWVPARLSYRAGDDDETPSVPPVDVTLDVELVDVLPAPPTPPDLEAPPRKGGVRLASGVVMRRLAKGTGTRRPGPTDRMTIHFSGWTRQGALFESTLRGGRPAVFRLADVVPGWREALPRMVAGDRWRLWVPAPLAYGERPRRPGFPAGDLVYDLELVAVE